MPVPRHIKIAREEDYYTHHLGRCADGRQFMGFVTATIARPPHAHAGQKRWYAVLHTFDRDGHHLDSAAWFAGTTAEGEEVAVERARAQLAQYIGELGAFAHGDISVDLFSVQIDGHTFGLVDASHTGRDAIYLVPNDFAFSAPWDGAYET